jgi:hypothetical protein
MNPLLVREVQPPLIYVGGDGRLNNTQSNNQYTTFSSTFYLSIVFLSRSLSFFVLESCEYRGSRGKRIDLGQPIAGALPDGVPPGRVGFRVLKAPADCLAYCAVGRVSFDVSCGASPPASRVHVTCSCVNTLFGDSAGD